MRMGYLMAAVITTKLYGETAKIATTIRLEAPDAHMAREKATDIFKERYGKESAIFVSEANFCQMEDKE